MQIERECKIKISDPAVLVRKLRGLGSEHRGRVYERNWVLDSPGHELREREILLRLRSNDEKSGAGVITVKRPAGDSEFKAREEIEVEVDSISTMRHLLRALGYECRWYYEKYRDYWRYRGCTIVLDELPEIGSFIEIEGPGDHAIRLVLGDLGLKASEHIPLNYLALFDRYCRNRGAALRDMRFQTATESAD